MKKEEAFLVEGFGGQKCLNGDIAISGSKNTALALLAATLLFEGEASFRNVPNIVDIENLLLLLEHLGGGVKRKDVHLLSISTEQATGTDVLEDIGKKMRASIGLTAPLLARFGKVSFPHPGGCVIGERPIDLFLNGFERMGATVLHEEGKYSIEAPHGLAGAEIFFPIQSVTGTLSFMMAGVLAKGKTVIKNAALEPEIVSLSEFLAAGGAKISGAGTSTIVIEGLNALLKTGGEFEIPPDRIESGSMLILGALCGDNFRVTNCNPEHIESLIHALRRSGISLEVGKDFVALSHNAEQNFSSLRSMNIRTHEYPGFPTDLQAPMVVYLTQVSGESLVFESIFEGRLNYCEELVRMGADIKVWNPHQATVKGGTKLRGRKLESPDLRAGLAFLIAALVAEGKSTIQNIHYIDRGYERIEERLALLGANIKRIRS